MNAKLKRRELIGAEPSLYRRPTPANPCPTLYVLAPLGQGPFHRALANDGWHYVRPQQKDRQF